MTTDQYSDAIPLLHQLVRINTTEDDYWVSMTAAYQQLGREQEAFATFQFRYLMDMLDCGEDGDDIITLGDLYMYHDVPYKAAQIFEEGLNSGCISGTSENWEKLGNAYFAAREWNRSRQALTRAANLAADGQLYYRIAGTWIQDENWSQARRYLELAIGRGGLDDTGQAHLLRGHACHELDDLDCAEEAFGRAAGYTRWAEDANTWLAVLENRRAFDAAQAAEREAYQEEAAIIREQQAEAANLAEAAQGLAQEAFENARLALSVSASERATLLETAANTLEQAREADDLARAGDFLSPDDVRERVRNIASESRQRGERAYAEELEEATEELLGRRETALSESDRLLREAEDLVFQGRQL